MGCVRVDKITDYLCVPLKKALSDQSPYVRKTAVLCVIKVFEINIELAIEHEFILTLHDMLQDENSMVVANVVSCLSEIHNICSEINAFSIDSKMLTRFLSALNECTE